MRPFPASSLVLLVSLVSTGTAQKSGTATPPPADAGTIDANNRRPVLTTTLPARGLWLDADVLRFTVTVSDPDGDPVSLKLLNPPPGLVFQPFVDRPSPVTVPVSWVVPETRRYRLNFEVLDGTARTVLPVESYVIRPKGLRFSQVLSADVTGDGIEDVVASAPQADVGGVVDAGAVYVWPGSPGPALPASTPSATLTIPGATTGDMLGVLGAPFLYDRHQALLFEDLSGDGVLDVVVAATYADVGGATDAGAVFYWKGGSALATAGGTVAPDAVLSVPGGSWFAPFGMTDSQGVLLEEVTGDAFPDVIVGSSRADVGGVQETGAVCVWAGGPGLSGSVAPTAVLSVPGAVAGDTLANGLFSGEALQVSDVSGDGIGDIVALATYADVGGVVDTGAIYVWAGGATLTETSTPSGTLTVPGAVAGDRLGYLYVGMQLADVTGDGVADVVSAAFNATVGGVQAAGEIYVWAGGSGVAGPNAPHATLHDPSGGDANLPSGGEMSTTLVDLNGDGMLDVLASAIGADYVRQAAGAVYFWPGGPGLTGVLAPEATLINPYANRDDWLGTGPGQSLLVADLTGDGKLDLVVGADRAEVNEDQSAGAIYVWSDVTELSGTVYPVARLMVAAGAIEPENLGGIIGDGIQLADVTGDGLLDVIAGHRKADVDGVLDAGALHVWRSEDGFFGSMPATTTLLLPWGKRRDWLGTEFRIGEVTGDGVLDIVVANDTADAMDVPGSGEVYLWAGGPGLNGYLVPTTRLVRAAPQPGDLVGGRAWEPLQLDDVTGDGVMDIVSEASGATTLASNEGAVLLWRGGPGLLGGGGYVSATAEFQGPGGGLPDDALSECNDHGIPLFDVTGDGLPDLIVGSSFADVAGVLNAGAIRLWAGGMGLTGVLFPDVSLTVPGAVAEDQLGQ